MSRVASYEQSPPKLIAGVRSLDFLNTVEWRGDRHAGGERLTGYAEFLTWAAACGLVTAAERDSLQRLAARNPRAAGAVLTEARAVRDSLAALLGDAERTPARAVAIINEVLAGARFVLQLEVARPGYRESWHGDGPPLRRPLLALLREAAGLLASGSLDDVRCCANERCRWFFLDTSRNHSRRWCRMETCGNNAKARAHYRRHRPRGSRARR